jgi:signal transduction histidine kinase
VSFLVPPSRRSWTEVAVAGVAVAVGVVAEADSYNWGDARHWLPDLLVGWTLIACGLVARRRTGLLLATTGFTWFAGNFASSTLVLHRGPLAQLVLTYPDGASGLLPAVALAYTVAAFGATWWNNAGTIALAAALVVAAAWRYHRSVGRLRREARYALRAAALLAAVLGMAATVNLTSDTTSARDTALLAYQAALCSLAVYLAYGAVRRPWERPAVTDLVVDLGETRTPTVREALAQALGDPTLEVAYRLGAGYVDAAGRAVSLPADGARRHVTRIEREGEEVAVLVHDAAMLDDPGLVDAVVAATRLAAANARLQAEVRTQVSELEASRRRLLEAADAERRRLEARLREGAVRRLAALEAQLADARATASVATAAAIQQAEEQLAKTSSDLHELAAGLHPRELVEHGLAPAVASLAWRSPIPVDVDVLAGRLPEQLEATIFFVCSEALTNIAKHAHASSASVRIEETGSTVRIEIRDDGSGGAEPRSIADRVEAVGGRLQVESPVGGGTRLLAEIPL